MNPKFNEKCADEAMTINKSRFIRMLSKAALPRGQSKSGKSKTGGSSSGKASSST